MIFLAHAPHHTPQAQALAELLRPQAWLLSRDWQPGEGLDAAHRRARVTALLLGPEGNDDPHLRALAALGAEQTHGHAMVIVLVDGPTADLLEGAGGCPQLDLAAIGLQAVAQHLWSVWGEAGRSPRPPPGRPTDTAPSPAQCLDPKAEQVPFLGRKAFLRDLEHWITLPERLSLRLITAEGGAGKTRLGWELARRRRAKGDKVEFLDGPPSKALLMDLKTTRAHGRWLLIVDGAAQRVPDLRALLQAALDHPNVHRSVRLLLLERAGGPWWEQLSDGLPLPFPLMRRQEERLLPALLDHPDDRARHHTIALGGADPAATPPDLSDPRYVHPLWVQMAALLTRQGSTLPESPTAQADAVLEQQRHHHARLIKTLTADPAKRRAETERLDGALVLTTLCGVLPPAEALTRAGEALGLPADPAQHIEAMARLFDLNRPKSGRLDARLPDALGERWIATHPQRQALLAAALDGPQADQALVTLARWAGGGLQRKEAQGWLMDGLATRLERLGPRAVALAAGATARDASEALCAALIRVMETAPRPAVEALYAAVCVQQHALPAVRAAAAARLLADWERDCKERWWLRLFGWLMPRSRAAALRDARAARLHQRAVAQAAQSQDAPALWTQQEAVALRRALADKTPSVYLPDLIQSQGHLSHLLSHLARKGEALELAKELVAMARYCFEEAPSVYLPDLVASLHTLSQRLSAVGRPQEALRTARESMDLHRIRQALSPEARWSETAQRLRDLAVLLRKAGAHDKALEQERAAADLEPGIPTPEQAPLLQEELRAHGLVYRMKAHVEATDTAAPAPPDGEKASGLVIRVKVEREALEDEAQGPPDAAEDDWQLRHATESFAHGAKLADLGHREKALHATQEAVDLLRASPERDNAARRPLLASALNNLGNLLDGVGRRTEALEASLEAVRLRRALSEVDPSTHRHDLVQSLCNLGNRLVTLGQPAEAVAVLDEATGHLRALEGEAPGFYRSDLAMALTNLGAAYRALGRHAEALQATQAATEHYRTLSAVDPRTHQPDLAMLLSNQGAMLSTLNLHEEALAVTIEAHTIYKALFERRVGAIVPNHAQCLNNLANRFARVGRKAEALTAAQEAVAIYRDLNNIMPRAFRSPFALSLTTLASRLSDLGRHAEAVTPAQASVTHFRALVALESDTHMPGLATSLNNLGLVLSHLNRREEALQATEEAVDHFRHLSVDHPATGLPELAKGLSNLGIQLSALGRGDDALRVTEEGVQVARTLCGQSTDFQPILVANLRMLALRLMELRRPEAAQRVQQEVDALTGVH